MIGTTVSHYKILEKLGEGGMGVVYKAQDTKLDRAVALKFLPQYLGANEAEQARFLQEARAASALNHPNICAIHALGEHEGQIFIDMELIDGETLRNRIGNKGLRTGEAVDFAIQIGEAIQEAHAHGIIHRDVKTDNIMINAKNQAKVMDFGLAKLRDSLKLTKTTSTVGTLAYMAPEQIEGKPTDARSDIFSFGVVLYEMLTGHFPFRGEHEAAMMYSIVNEESEPIQKYLQQIPSELAHVIGRALEKDPDDRYQSMSDVVIDLKRLKRSTSRLSLPTFEPVAVEHRTRMKYLVAGGAFVLLLVAAVLLFVLPRANRNAGAPMVTRMLAIPNLSVNFPNISPDGNWVVFVAEDARHIPNVYLVHATGGEPKQVTQDTEYLPKQGPSFSPDASLIAFERITFGRVSSTSDIFVVPALGGTPRKFVSGGVLPMWSPDGNQIAFYRQNPATSTVELFIAKSDGSGERKLESITPAFFLNEAWSPDSRSIAFLRGFLKPNQERYTEIFIRPIQDSSARQLTYDQRIIDDFCWTPDNEIVYNSTRGGNVNLWRVAAGGGTPSQLTLGSGSDRVPRISRDGRRLIYVNESQTTNLWRLDIPTGQVAQLTFEEVGFYAPSYSPDGGRMAFYRRELFEGWLSGFVVANREGMEQMKVALSLKGYNGYPPLRWTPDGASLLFAATQRDTVRHNPDSVVVRDCLLEHDISGGVTKKIGDGILVDASRDGKYLLYQRSGDTAYWRMVLALRSDPGKEIREITAQFWSLTQFSWDSKTIFTQDTMGIWSQPAEQGKGRILIKGTKKLRLIRQMPDGKSLLATEYDPGAKINRLFQFEQSSGKTRMICPLQYGMIIWGANSSVSPDGKSLLFIKAETKNRIVVLDNFK